MRRLLLICFLVCGSAIADEVLSITYKSEPAGALLYEGDKFVGYAPYIARYQVRAEHHTQGFVKIIPVRAQWASGATATLSGDPSRATLNQERSLVGTFKRPEAPGLNQDLQFALDRANAEISRRAAIAPSAPSVPSQQQTVSSDGTAGWAYLLGSVVNAASARQQSDSDAASANLYRDDLLKRAPQQKSLMMEVEPSTPRKNTNCLSNVIGNQVYTNCN